MIPSDTPWAGLEPGRTDTRRIDARARWNWFWAVMPREDAALVLQLSQIPEPLPELPNLRSLEIRFQTLPGGPILFIRLRDISQIELFETLCRDVVAAGELGLTECETIERTIRRTFRWHYLLRGGRANVLSEEEQKGLIGEIEILKLLIEAVGAKSALAAWTGPAGSPKDFELGTDCIEVKARRGASQPFVRITSEHQLADVPERRLWLSVLAVDKVQPPMGQTLSELIHDVTRLLERTAPSAITDWDVRLVEAGYDALHDYSAWRWLTSAPEFHQVAPDFPRIGTPVPLGVSDVTYALSLDSCLRFRTSWAYVRDGLMQTCSHE